MQPFSQSQTWRRAFGNPKLPYSNLLVVVTLLKPCQGNGTEIRIREIITVCRSDIRTFGESSFSALLSENLRCKTTLISEATCTLCALAQSQIRQLARLRGNTPANHVGRMNSAHDGGCLRSRTPMHVDNRRRTSASGAE